MNKEIIKKWNDYPFCPKCGEKTTGLRIGTHPACYNCGSAWREAEDGKISLSQSDICRRIETLDTALSLACYDSEDDGDTKDSFLSMAEGMVRKDDC